MTRFAVPSASAESVELCLVDAHGCEERRIPLVRGPQDVWHTEVEGLRPGQLYAYRADGPRRPAEGHRFDPSRLLVDPMARAIAGEPLESEDGDVTAPFGVVIDEAFDWQDDTPPRVPWSETVIYECHVRGMTRLHPEVDEELRGTYLGLVAPPVLEHLRRLGVTTVELLPVQQIATEPHLRRLGLRNYWGYSPLGFCAPHAGYATGRHGAQVVEFKTMVRELHRAGLEVLLDLVFNHTAEGEAGGPILSLKGLDNGGAYRLDPGDPSRYVDDTGCGNTLDFSRPAVREMALQALRTWVREMHVDGFRFDLATVLGRGPEVSGRAFETAAPFFEAIAADPALRDVKLIAEPWDLGPGGYRLGEFPASWAEWNDRFRITTRSFWRGDPGALPDLATRWVGSQDRFASKGPLRSIHYVACHDGFTLSDLVSYEHKHNQDNGEDNRDGSDHNQSRNWGHEGPTGDPGIQILRDRARRNLLATVLLSHGTPMLQHGDELGRTQCGNNNAYCQDNELTWVDWSDVDREFLDFARRALALRQRFRSFRREEFLAPEDLRWWHPEGREMHDGDWQDPERRSVGILCRDPDRSHLLLLLNAAETPVTFRFPEPFGGHTWRELLDTATGGRTGSRRLTGGSTVAPYSLRVLAGA